MSKTNHQKPAARKRGHHRQLSVRSELRREPDLQKIAGTVIALAMAQAEKEAEELERARRDQAQPQDDREQLHG